MQHGGDAVVAALWSEAPAAVFAIDEAGRIARPNPAARALLGEGAEGAALAALAADPQEGVAAARRLLALSPGAAATLELTTPLRLLELRVRRPQAGGPLAAAAADVTEPRRRLRLTSLLAEVTRIGVWELGPDGRTLSLSEAALKTLGGDLGAERACLEAALARLSPRDRARVRAAAQTMRATARPFELEAVLHAAQGRRRRLRLTGHPGGAGGGAGGGAAAFGTVQDVTEEAERREHLHRLGAVSERTRNSVFITDAERRIVWANPAFERLTGRPLEEARDLRPRHVLRSPRNDAGVFERIDAALARGEGASAELLNVMRDGTERWVSVDVQSFEGPDGETPGVITVETDITPLKTVEARLREAEAEAREARMRLESAIETLPDGFALWDASGRLALCNSRYVELYPEAEEARREGWSFERILREGLARGRYSEARGREAEWLAERLAAHRNADAKLEQRLGDGRWLRIVERPTPDGGRVGLRVDITELKRQQAALIAANRELKAALQARDAAEARFRDIAAVSSDWFWEQDAEGRFTYVSDGVRRALGLAPEEIVGRMRAELVGPAGLEDLAPMQAAALRREPFRDVVVRYEGPAGTAWVRLSGAPFRDVEGRHAGWRGTGSDVTALFATAAEARAAERALDATLDAIPDALIETDARERVHALRPGRGAAATVLQRDARRGGESALAALLPPEALGPAREALAEAAERGGSASREMRRDGPEGPRWLELTAVRKRGGEAEGPEAARLILLVRDVSGYKLAEREMRRAALTDPLTGLPNRRGLAARMERMAGRAAPRETLAVMHVDLDRFKAVNDTLGHDAGDHVLVRSAEVLREETRDADLVARVGGDEFVVVMRGARDGTPEARAEAAAERLTARLAAPIPYGEAVCRIGASVGIASWRPHERPAPERALTDADIALYEAKRAGRGRWRRFEPWMRARAEAAAQLGQEIRAGLERDEFEAWLQPQVALADGRLTGFEALIRWRHPERGVIGPGEFLFAAEEAALVARLDDRMLELACAALAWLRAAGLRAPRVSVNVSGGRLADPDVVDRAKWTVEAAGLSPGDVGLEIVESVLLEAGGEGAAATVRRLAEAGFGIELDDFGSGHASISTLRTLPVDRIKVDRRFVAGVDGDPELAMMTGAIVGLGVSLGLEVLAEGVERAEEREAVAALGCHVAQGFLFGHAMTAPEAEAWLRAHGGEAPAEARRAG